MARFNTDGSAFNEGVQYGNKVDILYDYKF